MDPLSLEDLAAHHRRVRGLVASLVGDPDLGEDAVQGAWLRLLEAKGSPGPHHLGAWLHVTAKRVASNERRAGRRRRDRERLWPRPESVPSSAEIAERTEISARVLAALDALGEPHGSVLRDHYLGGLSAAQLASRDALALETVRSRLRRARAAFRARLEADGLGGDVHWSLAAAPLVLSAPSSSLMGSGLMASGAWGAATGWIAMKKLAATALLVVSVLLGERWLTAPAGSDDSRRLAAPGAGGQLVFAAAANGKPGAAILGGAPPGPVRSAVEVAPAAPELHRVRGKVVDADGLPIEGALVVASSKDEWAGSSRVVRAGDVAGPRNGFETRSDREGVFSFEVPLAMPCPVWVYVSVSAGRHYTLASKGFRTRSEAVTAARPQPADLGTIQLGVASAILGRVTAPDGAPIAGAKLSINSKEFGSIGEDAVSAADGHYVLGHNPAGEFVVRVKAEGYYQDFREGVMTGLGEDTPGVDFVLGKAPFITGRLVDQDGAAVVGQTVLADSTTLINGSTFRSHAITGEDGAFRIHAARATSHELSVRGDGIEKRKGERVIANPGDDDVLVVIRRLPVHMIRVVDDETGTPLETFGARASLDWGGLGAFGQVDLRLGSPPRAKEHPGGTISLPIRVGVDCLVVASPGYESAMGAFALDEGSSDLFTARLKKCPVVRGRVLVGGEPAHSATIIVEAAKERRKRSGDRVEPPTVFQKDRYRRFDVAPDADGRFDLPTFGLGRVRVTAKAEAAAYAVVLDIAGEDVELGDVELEAYGVIDGQVLVPDGQSPAGLQLWLDEWSGEVNALTGTGGRFRLERVVPGVHQLVLRGRDPELESMTGEPFEVLAGERIDALLDASSLGRAELKLTILVDGEPASGAEVDVLPGGVDQEQNLFMIGTFGICDELGQVRGHCRTHPRVSVAIRERSRQLFHPDVFLAPRLGEVQEHTINFETAGVSLTLPEGTAWPDHGYVELEVLCSDRSVVLHERSFGVREGKMPRAEKEGVTYRGGVLHFPRLLAGPQILRLTVRDQGQLGTTELVDGEYVQTPGPNDFVLEGPCTLRPGAENYPDIEEVALSKAAR